MISSKRIYFIKYFTNYMKLSRGISVKAEPLLFNSRGVSASFNQRLPKYEKKPEKFEDTFGNLTDENEIRIRAFEYEEDQDDIEEMKRQRIATWKPMTYYIDKIKSHLKNHDYKSALEVLEIEMLKIDKKKPDQFIYDILLCYNGKVGNLKEAYRLYIQLKKRQFTPNGGNYTSLFNAAANCNDRELALQRLEKLTEDMMASDFHTANVVNYNAMIKAYGRHGYMEMCLKIMDAVLKERGRVKAPTYNFLLQSCITDKNSGFRHALSVWHKMLQNRTKPDIYSFRLMLRCVRECSLGPVELLDNFIRDILKYNNAKGSKKITEERKVYELDEKIEFAEEKENSESTELEKRDNDKVERRNDNGGTLLDSTNLPNLLTKNPVMGSIVQLNHIATAQDRFLLLGGVNGFFKTMNEFGIKPCDRIATQLLDVIPNTMEAEKELISVIDEKKIEVKTSFVNVLLKRRIFRCEEKGNITDTLKLLQKYYISPDILTYGILALSCSTLEEGDNLIKDLKNAGFRLNDETAGALLYNAAKYNDLKYAKFILNAAKENEVQPGPIFLKHLKRIVNQNQRLQDSSRQGRNFTIESKETDFLTSSEKPYESDNSADNDVEIFKDEKDCKKNN